MQRRLVFIGGSSAKFWQVTVADGCVAVRYGRIGTEGQRQAKSFDNATQAMRHAEGLIRQKLAKGYTASAA